MSAITLNGSLDADAVAAVARGAGIELGDSALAAVAANRAVLEEIIAAGTPLYGITTGFGALVSERVAPEFHRRLQVNLLRSHASGTGEELSREVVRAARDPPQQPSPRAFRRASRRARAHSRDAQPWLRPACPAHRLARRER